MPSSALSDRSDARGPLPGSTFRMNGNAVPDRKLHIAPVQHVHGSIFGVFVGRKFWRQLAFDKDGRIVRGLDNEFRLEQPGFIFI